MSDTAGWDALLKDPAGNGLSKDDVERIGNERTIAQVAHLLHARGQAHAAALMLDVQALAVETRYLDGLGGWGSDARTVEAVLDVETFLISRFTDERLAEIKSAFESVLERRGTRLDLVRVREVLPAVGPGWRDQLAHDLALERPTNQASRVRLAPYRRERDGLYLTNLEEERVYVVLREVQATLPDNETILIAPLPGVRVLDHTYYPDFLITYRGRAGVIEVDGPHHHGRAAADASRALLLEQGGIRYVGRIVVEDLAEKSTVERFVRNFLKRLVAS